MLTINDDNIINGFDKVCELTGLMGRWQKLSEHPLTICDTGHNLAGWEYLSKQIKETSETLKHDYSLNSQPSITRIIFGMVDDKDVVSVINLLPKDAEYYFCQASTKRAIESEKIASIAETVGLNGKFFSSVEIAYRNAIENANNNDFIFVGGSSYIVADLLTYLANLDS